MTAHQSLGPARSFFLNEGVLGESRSRVVGEDICISLVTGVAGAYQSGPTDMGGEGGGAPNTLPMHNGNCVLLQ